MSTAPLHRLRAIRCPRFHPALALVALLAAGCGDQDEAETPPQAKQPGLVPVQVDTAAAAPLTPAGGDSQGPGTSSPQKVQPPVEVDNAALRAKVPEARTDPGTAERIPMHRPRIRSAEGDYSLQLGSFRSAENARRQADRLRELGYEPELEVASLGGQTYHRVVLRGFPERAEAERLGEHIRSQLGITYLIRQK